MENTLYVIGYGFDFNSHLSRVGADYIARSEVLVCLEAQQEHICDFLPNKPLINYSTLYEQGRNRSDVYHEVVQEIKHLFSDYQSVGLLVEGTPYFLDSIVELLEADPNLSVNVAQGVSSLENIIYQLKIPIESVTLLATTAKLFCNQAANESKAELTVLFQPANADSNIVNIDCESETQLDVLIHTLSERFSPDDVWMIMNVGKDSFLIWNTIQNLKHFKTYFHSGTLIISRGWLPAGLTDLPLTQIED